MSVPKDLIRNLDAVALIEDVPEHGLVRGEVGAVVVALGSGVFEVEFVDDNGHAYAQAALSSEQLIRLRYRHAA